MQAVILAGGRGTRLAALTGGLPKPLIDIGGRPLLVRQIELLQAHGVTSVLVLASYRADLLKSVLMAQAGLQPALEFAEEDEAAPLGTAGALLNAFHLLKERMIVLYGDCMLNVDVGRMLAWHRARGAQVSLLVHPNDHPEDSDLVEADPDGRVTALHSCPHPAGTWLANQVNAALYVIEKPALALAHARWRDAPETKRAIDIARHLFPQLLASGTGLYAYRSPEYIKDAGTPKRYARVLGDWCSGRIARTGLDHPQKAIFLDRDGTLNEEVDHVTRAEELRLIPGVGGALRRINESEFRAVVVTNQPVLARGDCDAAALARIHAKLDTLLGREGAYLDALYYCPHHPHRGYAGEVRELKIDCTCRKPGPGLLLAAKTDLNIDFAQSWMIGDSTVDLQTAKALGIRSVLVETGKAGKDGAFDAAPLYRFATLEAAARFIIDEHPSLFAIAREASADWQAGECAVLGGEGDLLQWAGLFAEACTARGLQVLVNPGTAQPLSANTLVIITVEPSAHAQSSLSAFRYIGVERLGGNATRFGTGGNARDAAGTAMERGHI